MRIIALPLADDAWGGAAGFAVLGEHFAGMPAGSVSLVLSIAAVVALAGVALSALAARKVGRLSTIAALVAVGGLAKLMIAAVPWGPAMPPPR
ncbi:hypothetical protein AB0J35_43355 [Nonomuraea angiospora]|uniref:hypothetical protein n=1 Tax=Nonomuraea angiospora TaxID=46172 RepID=UPI00341BE4AC